MISLFLRQICLGNQFFKNKNIWPIEDFYFSTFIASKCFYNRFDYLNALNN